MRTMAPCRCPSRSHSSPSVGAFERAPLRLLAPLRAYPSAEHSTDLVDMSLQRGVLLRIYGASLFHESHKKAQQVELRTRAFKNDDLVASLAVPSFENTLDHIENRILTPLIDGVAVCLRDHSAILVKGAIEIVGLFQDRNV